MILPLQLGVDTAASRQIAQSLSKLKETSQSMEAQFVKQMLQAMKKAMPDTTEGEGFGNDEYQDMFDDAVSHALSKKTGLGISQTVFKTLAPTAVEQTRKRVMHELKMKKMTEGNS